jgi:hypothetical protein
LLLVFFCHQWSVDTVFLCNCLIIICRWFQRIQKMYSFLFEFDSVTFSFVTSISIVSSPLTSGCRCLI